VPVEPVVGPVVAVAATPVPALPPLVVPLATAVPAPVLVPPVPEVLALVDPVWPVDWCRMLQEGLCRQVAADDRVTAEVLAAAPEFAGADPDCP
jgi:hypothetical protein